MASCTACGDTYMVEFSACEGGGAMAQRTFACLRMGRESRNASGARSDDTQKALTSLMAIRTATCNANMVEPSTSKADGGFMASLATCAGRYMVGRLG